MCCKKGREGGKGKGLLVVTMQVKATNHNGTGAAPAAVGKVRA